MEKRHTCKSPSLPKLQIELMTLPYVSEANTDPIQNFMAGLP